VEDWGESCIALQFQSIGVVDEIVRATHPSRPASTFEAKLCNMDSDSSTSDGKPACKTSATFAIMRHLHDENLILKVRELDVGGGLDVKDEVT
jgi:hypothetical protein